MTLKNERSNKERKWKSQNIFSSLRELQSKRLSKLFTHDWIRSQFRQEQFYKNWIVSRNKKYLLKSSIESSIFIIANSMTRKKKKNVDKLIEKLEILRIYLRKKLKWTQNKMKKQINRDRHSTSKFRVNDTIMLNARFQKLTRLNASLNYKNLNFFKIAKMYHKNSAYKLDLLAIMKNIFLVFHSWLLHFDDDVLLKEQH